jgi:hypothetical protein
MSGQTVLTGHHENVARSAGLGELVRQHGHGKTGRTADLHGMGVARLQTEMLREERREHQVRQGGRIAADQAVDLGALQARVGERCGGGGRHEVERAAPLMPPEGGHAGADDEAHRASAPYGSLSKPSPKPLRLSGMPMPSSGVWKMMKVAD